MNQTGLLIAALVAGPVGFAQTSAPLRFEVASINTSGSTASSEDLIAATVTFHNSTLRSIVRLAFAVDDLLLEAPDWMRVAHFDITAKVPSGSVTLEKRRQMLASLLADRFALAVHREAGVRAGFALVVAKNGLRIQPVEGLRWPLQRYAGRKYPNDAHDHPEPRGRSRLQTAPACG